MDDPISEFKTWYLKQPALTRYYLTGSVIIAILLSLGIASPYSFLYTFDTAFRQFEVWRILTTLLFQGKFSFGFIFSMFFAYFGLSKVQSQLFDRNTYADFLWLSTMLSLTLLLIASFFNLYFLGDAFIMAFIYIWCKRRPFETIRFFFGFQVKSGYFPFVLILFRLLMGGNILVEIIGLLLGHLYITVKDIYTVTYQKDFLKTPNFFKKWVYGNRAQIPMRQRPAAGGIFGGAGVRIG